MTSKPKKAFTSRTGAAKERHNEAARRYREKHKAEILAKAKEYYSENSEIIREKTKAYYYANNDAAIQRAKEYRVQNAERIAEAKKDYYRKNKQSIKEAKRKWEKENPEKAAAIARNKRARRRSAEGRHSAKDIAGIFDRQRGLCANCLAPLKKTGANKFHVDHIIPLVLGGTNWKENLQCLCPSCNSAKGGKDPLVWAAENGRLL